VNIKRFIIAVVSVFVIVQLTDFIFHNVIQGETYNAFSHIWRKDMMDKMWVLFVVSIMFSLFFVYIYIKGFMKNSILGGIKYGIVMSFVQPFIASLSQYAIYPLPFFLIVQWYIFGIIQFVLCGIVVSVIYKNQS